MYKMLNHSERMLNAHVYITDNKNSLNWFYHTIAGNFHGNRARLE